MATSEPPRGAQFAYRVFVRRHSDCAQNLEWFHQNSSDWRGGELQNPWHLFHCRYTENVYRVVEAVVQLYTAGNFAELADLHWSNTRI